LFRILTSNSPHRGSLKNKVTEIYPKTGRKRTKEAIAAQPLAALIA